MRNIIITFVILLSTQAFAISNEGLVERCFEVGIEKIKSQAESWGCDVDLDLDLDNVEVNEIDNRWYNPSKYVWYQIMGECNGSDRVIRLV